MSVGGFTPYRQLGSHSQRKQVLTYSVLVENKFFSLGWLHLWDEVPICSSRTQCPVYSVASLGQHVIGPHANPPSHIIRTPGQPVMFRGPHFNMSTVQAGTTPIFKVFSMTWPSTNRESNPQNLLVSTRSPLAIVALYDQQDLFVTRGLH